MSEQSPCKGCAILDSRFHPGCRESCDRLKRYRTIHCSNIMSAFNHHRPEETSTFGGNWNSGKVREE